MAQFKNHNIVTREELPEDIKMDRTLRPKTLAEFIGQEKMKRGLKIFIEAAQQRKEALDHTLFHDPGTTGWLGYLRHGIVMRRNFYLFHGVSTRR